MKNQAKGYWIILEYGVSRVKRESSEVLINTLRTYHSLNRRRLVPSAKKGIRAERIIFTAYNIVI